MRGGDPRVSDLETVMGGSATVREALAGPGDGITVLADLGKNGLGLVLHLASEIWLLSLSNY